MVPSAPRASVRRRGGRVFVCRLGEPRRLAFRGGCRAEAPRPGWRRRPQFPIPPDSMFVPLGGRSPRAPASAFVAPGAAVIGDVVLGEDASVWFAAVLRGDVNAIRVGARSNLQDGVVVHGNAGAEPVTIADEVTVGHRAILHGCRLGRRCLVGMGSVVLDGVSVGEEAMVAAGAVAPPGLQVPPRVLVRGVPARVARPLTNAENRPSRRIGGPLCGAEEPLPRRAGGRPEHGSEPRGAVSVPTRPTHHCAALDSEDAGSPRHPDGLGGARPRSRRSPVPRSPRLPRAYPGRGPAGLGSGSRGEARRPVVGRRGGGSGPRPRSEDIQPGDQHREGRGRGGEAPCTQRIPDSALPADRLGNRRRGPPPPLPLPRPAEPETPEEPPHPGSARRRNTRPPRRSRLPGDRDAVPDPVHSGGRPGTTWCRRGSTGGVSTRCPSRRSCSSSCSWSAGWTATTRSSAVSGTRISGPTASRSSPRWTWRCPSPTRIR